MKIIKRMKSKGFPCPLHQISIICFKKCPYLSMYITAICAKVWETNHISSSWKRAVSILIYKKDSTDNPSNFRPITLEPVALKIFTSLYATKYVHSYVKIILLSLIYKKDLFTICQVHSSTQHI